MAIQGIGGFMYYAPSGGIAPDGVLQAGYITFDNMAAYNEALAMLKTLLFIQLKISYKTINKQLKTIWNKQLMILSKLP